MNNKRLQAEWYKKLRDAGFKDIEYLPQASEYSYASIQKGAPSTERFQRESEAKGEFYRLAAFFLHDHVFESRLERETWALYCEGVPYRDIATETGLSLSAVFRIIRRIAEGPFKAYSEFSSGDR